MTDSAVATAPFDASVHRAARRPDDWVTGLGDRYAQAGIAIDVDTIHKSLYYSHELPLQTMLICQHTLYWLEQDRVTVATVDQAVNDARRHPSWDLPA